jgi:outer membrane protein OmpA-like peptidoglycan-associated protein
VGRTTLTAILIMGAAAMVQQAIAQQRSFVSCPIVRDTKTVPCFLTEYDGETYYLGSQQDAGSLIQLPQLKHEVLVEGRVVEGPRVCGGIVLQPVSISVFKEVDLACSTLLPPEPGVEAPAPRAVQVRPRQNGPDFTILFPFDEDSLAGEGAQVVMDAAAYAQHIGAAAKVKITGYRATSVLSNGQQPLIETNGIAEKRAQAVAALLRGLGVQGVTAEWKDSAEPGDGAGDPLRRKVTISIGN